MELRRVASGLVPLLSALLAASSLRAAPPQFLAPPDDLSSLTGEGWRVLVDHDGSFVVQSGRRYLVDVTLRLTSRPGDKVAMQNFDGRTDDGFPGLDAAGALILVGSLTEKESKRPVRIEETLVPLDLGVSAGYALTVQEPVPLNRLSMWITLPIQYHMGSRVTLSTDEDEPPEPVFDVRLPDQLDRTRPIAEGTGQVFTVSDAEGPALEFRTLEPMRCVVEDCRQWETYYYVIRFEAPMVGGQLAPGQTLEMGLDVAVRPTQDAGPPARTESLPELTAERPIVQLTDDETTRGDWETTYGSEAYVLWGMTGAHLCGGALWPLPVRAYTGDPDQRIARWMSKLRELHDRRALLCPKYRDRRPSIADDTGESRPLGTGPDLLVDFSVPPGDHALSLYWFEIDYPQYRDYEVEFSDRAGKRLLTADARDFYNGVYKRFAVRGPQDLTVRIRRGMSINATLSGLFLDPLAADWRDPACANPVAHLRERGIQQVEGQSPELARVYDLLRQGCDREAEALCRGLMQGDAKDPTTVFAAELAYTLRTSQEDFWAAAGPAEWLMEHSPAGSPGRSVGVKAEWDRKLFEAGRAKPNQ